MLSQAILAPRDAILDVAELQRIALLFDHILVWEVDREVRSPSEIDLIRQEMDFLREVDVVKKCGPELPFAFRTKEGGRYSITQDLDVVIPYNILSKHLALIQLAPHAIGADRVIHQLASAILYKDVPIAAHVPPAGLVPAGNGDLTALQVVLDQIPFPAGDMPWQDFVQFRSDEENKASLRALRLWIRKLGDSKHSRYEIEDELLHLLNHYTTYMRKQGVKYRSGSLSAVVAAVSGAVGQSLMLNFGSALKSIVEIRSHSIELELAELSAPGREVSYIARASELIKQG